MTAILLVAVKLCVSGLVFGVGLGATPADLATLPRRPGLLLRSLLAMYVAVPLLALAAAWTLPLPPGVKVALLVLAISAGAPLLPRKLLGLHSDAYVFSLVVLSSLLAIVTVPLWLAVLGALFDRDAPVSPLGVARVIAISLLLPLAVGMLVRRVAPAWSAGVADGFLRVLGLVFIVAALGLLVLHLPLLALVPLSGWLALGLLTLAALACGHLLGGPDPDDRTALAVCCATRHVGVAALAAAAVPGVNTLVLLLAYLVVAAPVSFLYLRWRQRAAPAPA